MRRRAVLAVVLVAGVAATGCGKSTDTAREKARAAVSAAADGTRTVAYKLATGDTEVTVAATVEDDYRYQAELRLNGAPLYREVVDDDALAGQVVEPAAMAYVGTPLGVPPPAFAPGQWTVDDTAAPDLTSRSAAPGRDPVVDALTFLAYVRRSVDEGVVTTFDDKSLEYRPELDPFPKPRGGAVRYDVAPADLPGRSVGASVKPTDVPGPEALRQLAIYVRDGAVFEVHERVSAEPFLEELERAFGAKAEGQSRGRRATAMLTYLNKLRQQVGQPPVEPRAVKVTVSRPKGAVRVAIPADAAPAKLNVHVPPAA